MAPVNNLREQLLRGLRERSLAARNGRGLQLLQGARVTEDGIRPYPTIATEANIEALGESWPFPQLMRFMDRTLLFKDGNVTPVDVTEGAPWTLADITVTDKHGDAITVTGSGRYQVANFGAFTVMTNGVRVLFNKSGGSTLQSASTQIATLCNYKNSQLVMAGLGPSVLWHTVLKNFIAYRQAFEDDWPLPGNELATALVDDMQQWVWWSSVGGGDAYMFMDPHQLLLPPYHDVVLSRELLINGDFDTDTTGWTLGSGWTRAANRIVGTGATGFFSIDVATGYVEDPQNQKYYLLTFTWTATSGTCYVTDGTWESENLPAGVGPVTIELPIYMSGDPDGAVPFFTFIPTAAGFTGTIDNISMKEIVKHVQDYNTNLPSLLTNGLMRDAAKGLIETSWEGADGVSSWSAVPRLGVITNGNMYAGADSDGPAARYHKMFEISTWETTFTTPSDYLTQGLTHTREVDHFRHNPTYNFVTFDDDKLYTVTIHIVGLTAGSVFVFFGAGSGFDSRKNIAKVEVNGETIIENMQTDTNPGTFTDYVRVLPSTDFDGDVVLLHVEDEDFAILDAYAMESHTNHTALTQLSATMTAALIPGNRYRVKWKQMTYTPVDIAREGTPIFRWNEFNLVARPVNTPLYWDAEDGVSPWWTTSQRNILSNSLFYNGQVFGWVQGGNWAYDAGNDEMDHTTPALEDRLTLPATRMFATPVHGRTYDIFIEIRNRSAGQVYVRWGENNVGDNQWLVPAGNGYFVDTIDANNTATDWTRFVIATDAAFNGSIGEVMAMDRTRSVDPRAGAFEVYDLAAVALQDETLMNCYPLVDGEDYEVQFTYQDLIGSHIVRALVGGVGGTNRTAPGTYTETITSGAAGEIALQAQGTTDSVRASLDYVKPLFNEGVRPILATETEGLDGVSTYFENSEFGIYEAFTRDFLVPAAPANLDLAFGFSNGAFPVRISDVEIEPMDSETAVVDMQPKAVIFDYFERNEAGFAPIPFPGTPLRVLQLGEHIMVYGTNSVCYLETHTAPFHAKVAHRLPGFPRTLGVAGEGACNGDVTQHLFVDEKGMLWGVTPGQPPQVTKLDYQEFFIPMLSNTIVIEQDQETEAWRISDGTTGFYWRDGKLSETPDGATFLEFEGGGLVGHVVDFAAGDTELVILSNSFDAGDNDLSVKELYKVQVVGRSDAAAPFEISVDAKFHEPDTWTRFGPFSVDPLGTAITKVLGVEFRIMVRSDNADLAEVDDIRYLMRVTGKRSIGKWRSAV